MGRPYGTALAWGLAALVAAAAAARAGAITARHRVAPRDVHIEQVGGYARVTLRGADLPEDEPGTPWLPAAVVHLALPRDAKPTGIVATADETLLARDVLVLPVQPPVPTDEPAHKLTPPRPGAYAATDKVPETLAAIAGIHRLKGQRVVSVRLNPIRYVPARRELYLATEIRVAVSYEQGAAAAAAPQMMGDTSAVYLLITSDALATAFQPLVDRRTAQGRTGKLITKEAISGAYTGADIQEKIRNCIRDHYENHGTVFVALGGDSSAVPDRDCYVTAGGKTESKMPTDLYYGDLDGDWDSDGDGTWGEASEDDADLMPEVWVGRIPVRTAAQATAYIAKLVAYETATPSGFAGRMLLTGNKLGTRYSGDSRPSDFRDHDPVSDAYVWANRTFRDVIQPHWQPTALHQLFDTSTSWDSGTPGSYAESRDHLAAQLSTGYHHVYMITHGSNTSWSMESGGSFSTGNASALTNATTPSIVYTVACNTGAFDRSEPSLSEAFIRNPDGGAVAYLGSSRYGWYSPGSSTGGTSCRYAREFYKAVFEDGCGTLGEAFARHKMAMAGSSGFNGTNRWVQFGTNLQGDPAIAFAPAEPGRTLQVLSPNGGEQYGRDAQIVIRWAAGGAGWQAGDQVALEYSLDGGAAWQPIADAQSLPHGGAAFDWTPTAGVHSDRCRVRVSKVGDPPVSDASDRDFAVLWPRVIYVDADATGANDGTSWADAFTTIQAGLADANAGDEVWVAEGVYTGTGATVAVLVAEVGVYGGFDATESSRGQRDPEAHLAILDGQNARRCALGANLATLDGFVLRNGSATNGGGMACNGTSPTIRRCTITANTASKGGGIHCAGASPLIEHCRIEGNTATAGGGGLFADASSQPTVQHSELIGNSAAVDGGGAYVYGGALTRNRVVGNRAGERGGGLQAGIATVAHNVVVGNIAATGGGVHCTGDAQITHNTLHGNHGGIAAADGAAPTVRSCILWANGDDLDGCSAEWSCIEDGDPGEGNVAVDPLFAAPGHWQDPGTPVDPSDDTWVNGDYHLQSAEGRWEDGGRVIDPVTSPCIDAADPDGPADAEPEPNGLRANLGAWGNTDQASQTPHAFHTWTLTLDSAGAEAVAITGDLPCTTPHVESLEQPATLSLTAPYTAGGRILLRWETASGEPLGTQATLDAVVNCDRHIVVVYADVTDFYVAPSYAPGPGGAIGDDANPGTSPEAPMLHIQALLDRYPDIGTGCTVHVAAGWYGETVTLGASHAGLHLKGAGPGKEGTQGGGGSSLGGERQDSTLIFVDFPHGTVSGFSINGGYEVERGAAVRCERSSPTLTECQINWGRADYGAGICCIDASPLITRNVISGATAVHDGGALYCEGGAPTVTHNAIYGTTATRGAVYCLNAAATLANNTIAGNVGGGIVAAGSPLPTTRNCILWANGDDLDGCTATYSCIEDGDPGEGNIADDPLFAQPGQATPGGDGGGWYYCDLHLKSTAGRWTGDAPAVDDVDSPCLDAGDPADPFAAEPPDHGDRINMGAYGGTDEASASPSSVPPPGDLDIDLRPLVGGRMNPDAPGACSFCSRALGLGGNPSSARVAVRVDTPEGLRWLRLGRGDPVEDADDLFPAATEPHWLPPDVLAGCRIRGLAAGTSYTFHAAVRRTPTRESPLRQVAHCATNVLGDVDRSGRATALDYAYIRAALLRAEMLWSGDLDDSRSLDTADLGIARSCVLHPPSQ